MEDFPTQKGSKDTSSSRKYGVPCGSRQVVGTPKNQKLFRFGVLAATHNRCFG